MSAFKDRIEGLLAQKGNPSKTAIAKLAQINKNTFLGYFNLSLRKGEPKLTAEEYIRLGKALGVTLFEVLGAEPPRESKGSGGTKSLSDLLGDIERVVLEIRKSLGQPREEK